MYDIRCDLHTHTNYSADGIAVYDENIEAAKAAGLELLAFTDSFSSLVVRADRELGSCEVSGRGDFGEDDYRDAIECGAISGENHSSEENTPSISILCGAEVEIANPEGYLYGIGLPGRASEGTSPFAGDEDLIQRAGGELDFLIASTGRKLRIYDMTAYQAAEAVIKAIADLRVLMAGRLCRYDGPIDIREIVIASKALHKPIEINESDYKLGGDIAGRCMEIALICAEEGCDICVNSDARAAGDIGQFGMIKAMLAAIQFPEELIINVNAKRFSERCRMAGFLF